MYGLGYKRQRRWGGRWRWRGGGGGLNWGPPSHGIRGGSEGRRRVSSNAVLGEDTESVWQEICSDVQNTSPDKQLGRSPLGATTTKTNCATSTRRRRRALKRRRRHVRRIRSETRTRKKEGLGYPGVVGRKSGCRVLVCFLPGVILFAPRPRCLVPISSLSGTSTPSSRTPSSTSSTLSSSTTPPSPSLDPTEPRPILRQHPSSSLPRLAFSSPTSPMDPMQQQDQGQLPLDHSSAAGPSAGSPWIPYSTTKHRVTKGRLSLLASSAARTRIDPILIYH